MGIEDIVSRFQKSEYAQAKSLEEARAISIRHLTERWDRTPIAQRLMCAMDSDGLLQLRTWEEAQSWAVLYKELQGELGQERAEAVFMEATRLNEKHLSPSLDETRALAYELASNGDQFDTKQADDPKTVAGRLRALADELDPPTQQ